MRAQSDNSQAGTTFTSSGASNSPMMLGVTLTAGSQTPLTTGPLSFSFNVRDRESGGADKLLLDGTGSVDSSGPVTGSGHFTRYSNGSGEDGNSTIIATGTWSAKSVTSFTPVSGGGSDHLGAVVTLPNTSTKSPSTRRRPACRTAKLVKCLKFCS
jgi:hypothetical protein